MAPNISRTATRRFTSNRRYGIYATVHWRTKPFRFELFEWTKWFRSVWFAVGSIVAQATQQQPLDHTVSPLGSTLESNGWMINFSS